MRCSSRPAAARKIGAGRRLCRPWRSPSCSRLRLGCPSSAHAQIADASRRPTPTPMPSPTPTVVNSYGSAGAAVTNLGSSFLERLGNQASSGFGSAHAAKSGRRRRLRSAEPPRFRSWAEAYGISARTGAQGDFVGDRRRTWGGVAGDRRARCARRQCRRFGRSKPHRNRRSARAAIGNPRSHPVRLQRLGGQGSVDLGPRARPRLWKDQHQPRHRIGLRQRRLQRPHRRCADRAQLLLGHRSEPHRAEGRRSNMSASRPDRCRNSAASIP